LRKAGIRKGGGKKPGHGQVLLLQAAKKKEGEKEIEKRGLLPC